MEVTTIDLLGSNERYGWSKDGGPDNDGGHGGWVKSVTPLKER